MSRRNASILAAVTAVLLMAALGAALAGPWEMEDRDLSLLTDLFEARTFPTVTPDNPGFELGPVSSPGVGPDLAWMRYVAIGVAVAIGVGILVWLVQRYRMTRVPEPVASERVAGVPGSGKLPELPDLQEGVSRAQRVLEEATDPDDAIISAWIVLETAAADAGVRRRPSQTPTEFAVSILERTPADSVATQRLLGLYRRARFSQHPSTLDDVAEATRWLGVLADSWDLIATGSER